MIASLPNLLEGLAFSGFVALYIWRLQDASPKAWLLFPVWLVISFALHCESPKSLGWRADNLKAATQRAAPVFLFFMLIIIIAGIFLGALHRLPAHFVEPKRKVHVSRKVTQAGALAIDIGHLAGPEGENRTAQRRESNAGTIGVPVIGG